MWVKYREIWAYGKHEWEWKYFHNQTKEQSEFWMKEEFIPNKDSEYYWTDKYRGIEFEVVEKPPKNIILKEIEEITNTIKGYENKLKALKKEQDK